MKSRGLDHAPAGPIVACMSTFVYMVKVAPGTTGTEFEFFYAAASDAGANQSCAVKRRGFVTHSAGCYWLECEGWWRGRPNSRPNRRSGG